MNIEMKGITLGSFAVLVATLMAFSACLVAPMSDGSTYDGELTLYGYEITMGLENPDQVTSVEWDFGDESEHVTITLSADNSNGKVDHRYAEKGDYVVTATMRNTYTDSEGVSHDGETALTYLFHIMGYPNITFDSQGGSEVATIEGGKTTYVAEKPEDPTKEGYTFIGWFTDSACTQAYDWTSTVTKHMTLYAGWATKTFTVTFDLNGGTGTADAQTVGEGKLAVEPADPVRDGFIFNGWYLNGARYDFTSPVKADLALVANWTEVQPGSVFYKVTYDANGGSAEWKTANVVDGGTAVLPKAERSGYTFDGWYSGDKLVGKAGEQVKITEDMTLVAKWTENADAGIMEYVPYIIALIGAALIVVGVVTGAFVLGIPAVVLIVAALLMIFEVIKL